MTIFTISIIILSFLFGLYLGINKNKLFIGVNQKINQTYNNHDGHIDGSFTDNVNKYENRKKNYSEKEYKRLKKRLS